MHFRFWRALKVQVGNTAKFTWKFSTSQAFGFFRLDFFESIFTVDWLHILFDFICVYASKAINYKYLLDTNYIYVDLCVCVWYVC